MDIINVFEKSIAAMKQYPLLLPLLGFLIILVVLQFKSKSLDSIKGRKAGQGQHGTASFMNQAEKNKIFKKVKYDPVAWRKGKIPKNLPIGTIWGTETRGMLKKDLIALVDIEDRNGMMIGPAGVGKTAHFFIPNMEYAAALGLSMISTDTKGDLYRNIGKIQQKYYGYDIVVLDLRNPIRSDKFNLMQLVNEYMDKSKESKNEEERLSYSAKAEKYAKIVSKSIIESGDFKGGGQNAFFYDSAEGLITASVLLLAEFGEKDERHIVSVFKIIQDMCVFVGDGQSDNMVSRFGQIIKMLPEDHKAKWFAGAAVEADMKTALSVFSTSLSRLTKFIDSELEQMLCFNSNFSAEKFIENKTSVFIVLPEEDSTKHFMLSLFLNQIYRELLSIADEKGGKLDKRVLIFEDEFGTIPAIKDVDMMFSASRSRGILSYPIIQSFAQLGDKYGDKKAQVIRDNCQNVIFSGFAPTSKIPEELSKAMGTYTIQSGSVSESNGKGSKKNISFNLMGRPLMTADEIRKIKKGHYIVMMTGQQGHLKTKLPLFLKWGIKLDKEEYIVEKSIGEIQYISVNELENRITSKKEEKNKNLHLPNKEQKEEKLQDEKIVYIGDEETKESNTEEKVEEDIQVRKFLNKKE